MSQVRTMTRAEMNRINGVSHTLRGSDGDFEWAWTTRHDGWKWSYIIMRDHNGCWMPRHGVRVPKEWDDHKAFKALLDDMDILQD